ncbi:MAG: dihydropteroate synthase, partial [Bacteroidaceae bacterium]|nr:dihydropteroate synthase [Bacteroidaceae bacterium]
TPDSFYAASRAEEETAITNRVIQVMEEGADIIDIGACSTRPGASIATPQEEMERLRKGLKIIRELYPEAIVSVDTFRADAARMSVEEYGVQIINDVSGNFLQEGSCTTVAALNAPYILTHNEGIPQTTKNVVHDVNVVREMLLFFAEKIQLLRDKGVKDIIIDPGFGFAKTLEQNYAIMQHLEEFRLLELPILIGVSRKSMIHELLRTTPEQALNGTTVLNTIALMKGANILRIHDVKACVETVKIIQTLQDQQLC